MQLLLFSPSPLRYGEVRSRVALSDAVLTLHLKQLVSEGLIVKVVREGDLKPAYTITGLGEKYLSKVYEGEVEEAFEAENLYDEFYRRLGYAGFAADILKASDVLEALTIVSPFQVFKPGRLEDEYLRFASRLYVDSVVEMLGRKTAELTYVEVRAAWQLIDKDSWKGEKKLPGLTFNYPHAWEKNYWEASNDLKSRLNQRYGNLKTQQYRLFRRLKIWPFPLTERGKITGTLPPPTRFRQTEEWEAARPA